MRLLLFLLVGLTGCSKSSGPQGEGTPQSAPPSEADAFAPRSAQDEDDGDALSEESTERTDAELEQIISTVLLGDPRTAGAALGVDVSAGIAVLTGRAESREQANVAELLAREVPGVTRVNNYIRILEPRVVRPVGPPSDAAILASIKRQLGVGSSIDVSVEDGVVTLGGIANREELQDAIAIARAAGALEVHDQTRLVPFEITPP